MGVRLGGEGEESARGEGAGEVPLVLGSGEKKEIPINQPVTALLNPLPQKFGKEISTLQYKACTYTGMASTCMCMCILCISELTSENEKARMTEQQNDRLFNLGNHVQNQEMHVASWLIKTEILLFLKNNYNSLGGGALSWW